MMSDAAMAPLGTPGRDANFEDKERNFLGHSRRLADTALMVAADGGCSNKKTVEAINANAQQVGGSTGLILR